MVTLRNFLDLPKDPQKPNAQETTKVEVLGAGVGNLHGTMVERLFVGPKSLDALESVRVVGIPDHPDLRQIVDFGFFGIIARPLFLWLKWTYKYIGNWGWAIVIQTLIINVALLPLLIPIGLIGDDTAGFRGASAPMGTEVALLGASAYLLRYARDHGDTDLTLKTMAQRTVDFFRRR